VSLGYNVHSSAVSIFPILPNGKDSTTLKYFEKKCIFPQLEEFDIMLENGMVNL